jgi:hypothetical protein
VRQLKAHAVLVTIATTPRKPQAAYVNGQRLTIECLRGEGGPFVSYSPIDPVGWDSWVILKGRLPNGQHRWIGISAEDGGGVLVMAVRTRAGSGPCGFDVVKSNDWLLSVGTMIAS